ncbi:MAG TPA: VWA domain-containing protein [Solirubrobacteraceae bacterium]
MSFASPWALAGLALVPLLVAAYVAGERRRRRSAAFAAPHLMDAVAPRRPRWRRHVPVAAMGLAAAGLLVALARPQATVAVPAEQATVVVATDRSGSMLATDVAPSRLVAARQAAATFLAKVPADVRVGAVAFNHRPTVLQTPTRDHAAVAEALTGVQAAGSTATGDALAAALRMIREARTSATGKPPPAAVILLSDGKSVRGRDALAVAEEARKAKVPVSTVALGIASGTIESKRADGSTTRTPVPPDPATLRRIAERTGGEAFAIGDAARLQRVYERLGSQVATEKQKQEVTSMFAGAALLLLAGGAASSIRWFGRPL